MSTEQLVKAAHVRARAAQIEYDTASETYHRVGRKTNYSHESVRSDAYRLVPMLGDVLTTNREYKELLKKLAEEEAEKRRKAMP